MTSLDEYRENVNFQNFLQWRNHILEAYTEECDELESDENNEKDHVKKILKKLPKCLVHLTRKMCNCDTDCLAESFVNVPIDSGCQSFDLKNIWFDKKYYNCDFLSKKVKEGVFGEPDVYYDLNKLDNLINNGTLELCKSPEVYNDLLCKVLDKRDECKDDYNCKNFNIRSVEQKKCQNEFYDEQIEYISKIFDRRLLEELKHQTELIVVNIEPNSISSNTEHEEKNLCRKTYRLEVEKMLEKFDSNKKLYPKIKRSIENLANSDVLNMFNEYKHFNYEKNIENIKDCAQFSTSTMAFSIYSIMLFMFLVYLGLKDNKKNLKLIFPAIILTFTIVLLSSYTFLTL